MIVVTGEGWVREKLRWCIGLLERLDPEKVLAATLVSTQLDAEDTLRLVGAAFGIRTKDVSKSDLLMSLEAFLSAKTAQERCLLIVDRAQNLTARAVGTTHAVELPVWKPGPAAEFPRRPALSSGVLQSPQMMQFRQRVIAAAYRPAGYRGNPWIH